MNDALCSILCQQEDEWIWDPFCQDKVKFNLDGTGEVCTRAYGHFPHTTANEWAAKLWFLEDHSYLFAVNFTWRCNSLPSQPSQKTPTVKEVSDGRNSWSLIPWKQQLECLGTLNLEITLERTLARGLMTFRSAAGFESINKSRLSDAACRPKSFTVTIERGNFMPTTRIGHAEERGLKFRYGLRLLFDRTLCPPPEEFINPKDGIIDGVRWWRIKDYVGRELPKSEHRNPAMNSTYPSSYADSCILS